MSHAPDSLEAHKELLVARSALERARIRYEVVALRGGVLRGGLLGGGVPRAIGKVARVVAVVRTVLSVVRMVRGNRRR